ncbi:uncharacterized protein KY384_000415 [Bacidia gigantensis]|uniref:uncharacterized protein n=1 Tax=Bacidia gigantensis TaxID=2732470 RepID=UPI001D054751|nr:uncharacterized protein KY384_000415 [Bacidia gigantensis]KAG8525655.1 hypothetical protein KY384_000415 [Bacidia gigantensis]
MARSHNQPFVPVFSLLLAFIPLSLSQITLPSAVPTTGCIGNAAGSATFTSSSSLETGSQKIVAGDFWKQAAAVWEFSTDTKGVVLSGPGIPGAGAGFNGNDGGAGDAQKALKLSDDKSTITLAVPSPTLGGSWDIIFNAGSSAVEGPSSSPNTSPTWKAGDCTVSQFTDKPITCSGTVQQPTPATKSVCACPSDIMLDPLSGGDSPCGSYTGSQGDLLVVTNFCQTPIKRREAEPTITPPPNPPDFVPVGAKFRPRPRAVNEVLHPRQDAAKFNLIIEANVPCIAPEASATGPGASANPTIASLCSNNKITPGVDAWKTYEVPKYMASILSAAEGSLPTPTLPVDGVAAIHSDVNPKGAQCTYTSKCDSIGCSDVRDYNTGSEVSIQRFLGYQSVVNLNNYFYSVYDALFNTGTIGSLTSGNIVTTFFTNPTPDATWMQILGIFGPMLGMLSGMLAPFMIPSAALGIASGIVGIVGAIGTISNLQPVVDKRFDEYSSITDFIGHYIEATVKGLEAAYDRTIGKSTPIFEWSGSPYAPDGQQNGIFGDGLFADNDFAQDMTSNILDRMIRIFTYKAINFAWVDSGVFIIYVPYGRDIKGPDGKIIPNFSADYCKNTLQGKDYVGKLINCDAPGPGMAALHNAADGGSSGALKTPQGYDQAFNVLPDEKFDVMAAIAGSVNSWKKGDFNYDASSPYQDAFNSDGGPSPSQLAEIGNLKIAPDTAGFFNVPVCQTFDLRFFPFAGSDGVTGTPCTACGSSVAVGGTQGSTVKFMDKVGDIVKKTLQAGGGTYCGGYYGNSCSSKCPEDLYTG